MNTIYLLQEEWSDGYAEYSCKPVGYFTNEADAVKLKAFLNEQPEEKHLPIWDPTSYTVETVRLLEAKPFKNTWVASGPLMVKYAVWHPRFSYEDEILVHRDIAGGVSTTYEEEMARYESEYASTENRRGIRMSERNYLESYRIVYASETYEGAVNGLVDFRKRMYELKKDAMPVRTFVKPVGVR